MTSVRTKVKPPSSLSVTYSVISQGVFIAELRWTPATSAWPNSYYVIYRDGAEIASSISALIYLDTTVAQGFSYDYQVSTVNVHEVEGETGSAASLKVPSYPVWATGWSLSILQNQTDSVAGRCSDPDGGTLTFSKQGGTAPAGVTVASNGTVAVGSTTAGGYTLGIRASNGFLTSDYTASLSVNSVLVAPDPPINAIATAISATEAQLDWERAPTNPVPNDYDLRYSTTLGGSTTAISHAGTATTKSVTGLSAGDYYFEVRAGIDLNESSWVSFTPYPLTLSASQAATWIIPAGQTGALANLEFDGTATTHPNVSGPSRAIQPGDIIELAAGTHGRRQFKNISGIASNHVTIRNSASGQAILRSPTVMTSGFVHTLNNCHYVDIDGSYASSATAHPDYPSQKLGIKFMYASNASTSNKDSWTSMFKFQAAGTTGTTVNGVWRATSSHITMRNFEVDGGWNATSSQSKCVNGNGVFFHDQGVKFATAANQGKFQEDLHLSYFYIHDTADEGIYGGPNFPSGTVPLRRIELDHFRIEDAGGSGITGKAWWEGPNSIHDFVMIRCASKTNPSELNKVCGVLGPCRIYNGRIHDGGIPEVAGFTNQGHGVMANVNKGPLVNNSPAGYANYSSFEVEVFNVVTTGSVGGCGVLATSDNGTVPIRLKCYNVTAVNNNDDGITSDANTVSGGFIKNCISIGNGGSAINAGGGTTESSNTTTGSAASLFVNPSADDYHLLSSIPATGSIGIDIAATDLDGDTRPQGAFPDRGAYEYP